MKITTKWLYEKDACELGVEWFKNQVETNSYKVLKALITQDKLDWANWLIVCVMKRKQYLAYAIFAAKQAIEIYEKKYPKDDRPRKAIEAAKQVLLRDTKVNKDAARDAAWAAGAATGAAAWDAAWDARDAARAAGAARDAAWDAAGAAWAAARAAGAAAKKEMQLRILNYGIGLLEKGG